MPDNTRKKGNQGQQGFEQDDKEKQGNVGGGGIDRDGGDGDKSKQGRPGVGGDREENLDDLGKGVSNDEDQLDDEDVEDERITQRTPQQGGDVNKTGE